MSARESENARRANAICRGQAAELQEILDLADVLAEESAFGYARRILARAYKDPTVHQRPALRLRLAQKRALSTYRKTSRSSIAKKASPFRGEDELAHRTEGSPSVSNEPSLDAP
jgi:hypothetical protein